MPTWGELRLQLKQARPNATTDQLNSALRDAYAEVLSYPWQSLLAEASLVLEPEQVALVALTNNSQTVTGSGTSWTSALVGWYVRPYPDESQAGYRVMAVNSATELVLDVAYVGATAAEASIRLTKELYELPDDCEAIASMPKELYNQWEMVLDTPEAPTIPQKRQLRLLGAPLLTNRYFIRYTYYRRPYQFTGLNVMESPLTFLNPELIVLGARVRLGDKDQWDILQNVWRAAKLQDIRTRASVRPPQAQWMNSHLWEVAQ